MSLVTREDHGRVTVLTLNHPPANGYTFAMHRELDDHVVELRADRGTDVIVLRGAGDRFFCAGADIPYLTSLDPDGKYAFCLHANETLLRLENTPKLVIAALNGHCVGGGLEVALACDIRLARSTGLDGRPDLVGLPEVSLGVLPGTGGTQRLARVLGRAKAMQWMVEGRKVTVQEAHAAGLIHEVLPAQGWWEAVLTYAHRFTRPAHAAQAVGLIKRAVLGGADLPLDAGLALERELQMRLFTAPDAKEGLAAFVEKRTAHFTGEGPAPRPFEAGPHAEVHRVLPAPEPPRSPEPPRRPEPPRQEPPRAEPPRHEPPRHEPPRSEPPRHEPPRHEPPVGGAEHPPARMHLRDPMGDEHAIGRPRAPEPHAPRNEARKERVLPKEFSGFEDFADFGADDPDEMGGHWEGAFGTGGVPHASDGHAEHHEPGHGRIDLHRTRIPDHVLNLVPRGVVEQYGVLPVKRTETTLLVAMVDPHNAEALAAVAEETGLDVQAVRAPEEDIAVMIARYYRA